ncbi:TNF receptor-associated factor 4-like isoform X1 [Oopsacas minuta]|uniref:TNF receptor-associated factor 4-like isoform X1 n=1 Tax=Oopsacas minuta TaxID=111878 RepID=A0AAV7K3X6_9METZ|nr:TNF receptor-associated factor 4-like isoform X1 [Oopsacas minuta]
MTSSQSHPQSLLCIEKDGNSLGYKPDLLKEEIPSFLRTLVICSKCEGLTRGACGIGSPQTFVCLVCAEGNPYNVLITNREIVSSLIIFCPLKSRGCDWEDVISSAEAHLDTCEYFHKECHLSCGAVIKRIHMNTHITQQCTNRILECEFCTESHRAGGLTLHLEVCTNFPLQCVNKCGETILRQDMQSHIEDMCSNTLLECDYKKYGCCERVYRNHLDTHNNDNRLLHMEMKLESLQNKILQTNNENSILKEEINSKTTQIEKIQTTFDLIAKDNQRLRQIVEPSLETEVKFEGACLKYDKTIKSASKFNFMVDQINDVINNRNVFVYLNEEGNELTLNNLIHKISIFCRCLKNKKSPNIELTCEINLSSRQTYTFYSGIVLMNQIHQTTQYIYKNSHVLKGTVNICKLASIPWDLIGKPGICVKDSILIEFFYHIK